MSSPIDELYEPYLHTGLLEAGRALATSISQHAENKAASIGITQGLFNLLLDAQVSELAEAARSLLAQLTQTSLHEVLSEWALRAIDGRRSIQRMGMFAGSPKVLDALILLLTHNSGGVRSDAARALEHSAENPRVRDALLQLLSDESWDVRRAAARALRPLHRNPEVESALNSLLPYPVHADPSVVAGLGALALNPNVRAALLSLLEHADYVARYSAASELQEIVADPGVHTRLVQLLGSPNNDSRTVAAWTVLGAWRDRDRSERDRTIQELARAVDALRIVLKDPHWYVRSQAVFALHLVVDQPYAQSTLVAAMDDTDARVRSNAIEALEPVVAVPTVTTAMVAHLSDRHVTPRAYAAFALKPVAEEPAVRDALLPLLADPAYLVREWAARSLGSSASEPKVTAAMLSLLSDPVESVRAMAAEALAPVAANHDVQEALLYKRTHQSCQVRAGVAKALGPLAGDSAILAALRPLLEDSDEMVRRHATEALGPACGDPTVRAVAGGKLADPDDLMSICVLAALENAPLDRFLVAPIGELTYSRDRGEAESAYAILRRWRVHDVVS